MDFMPDEFTPDYEVGYCGSFCMDITCKSLKEFAIIQEEGYPKIKWVF